MSATLERAVGRLASLRHPEGYFEGFSDAGVAFDAANVLLARFVGDDWPEDAARVTAKMRHVLSGQHASGLFLLYPEGPCSVDATRIVYLAIRRVLESGPALDPGFREELERALDDGERAARDPGASRFELAYLFFFRLMLEALDDNTPSAPRLVPAPRLAYLFPIMMAGLVPKAVWQRTDRVVYPFIAVLPQLLSTSAWRAFETSRVGAALVRVLDALPRPLRATPERAARGAARWLLDRQDETGGFYYSALYTFLFVAGLRDTVALAGSATLEERAAAAADRALAYVRSRESVVPTGISTSFVASDVWDSAAVATSLLDAPPGVDLAGLAPEPLAAYVLDKQSPSGGFSYGHGSKYPDVDSTGLVLGLFAAILARDPPTPNRAALLASLVRAFDFLEQHRSAKGGFNAWTIRHGATPPPMPSSLTSLLFDVSSADVTARVMVSLGRLLDLVVKDDEAARVIGPDRIARAERLRARGLDYLRGTRDPSSGLWPARWTLGYVIGTRFVFDALESYPEIAPVVADLRDAAARTLVASQNADGGFGESPDSDTKGRFTPSNESAALVTAAAFGVLREARGAGSREAASRALEYLVRTQRADGGWPERSLCTQFAGLYASYELMTQVALMTTLFRFEGARSPSSAARTAA